MRLRDGYAEPDETGLLPTKTFRDEAALACFVKMMERGKGDPRETARLAYLAADALIAAR